MVMEKFFIAKNWKGMMQVAKLSNKLDKHMKKRCAYCDMDMGTGDNVPVVDFVDHLIAEHPEKITPDEAESFRKLLKKVGK